ncbi:MAG: hypothetical protein JXA73_07160 [Acidobacteria bacterium]|nr:hypothetical protein [Acidobacteriota bacterium]
MSSDVGRDPVMPEGLKNWISKLRIGISVLVILYLLNVGDLAAASSGPLSSAGHRRTFIYSMSGRVRLLLFWIGRDNVGGGRVTIEKSQGLESPMRTEKITVLFGTRPERVPWRINRWGYGEETGQWDFEKPAGCSILKSSRFAGFIRHSPEESISQLSSSNERENSRNQYWYDGIISIVKPDEAQTQVFYFPLNEEATVERMNAAENAFQSRSMSGVPDKSRRLTNQPARYDSPQGFLICLQRMLAGINKEVNKLHDSKVRLQSFIRSAYVYNAKLYYLELKKIKLHKDFKPAQPSATKTGSPLVNQFHNVVEAGLEIVNADNGERQSFLCWSPLEGPLENIPIQIQCNPRWWLQVRLQLVDMEETIDAKK